MMKTISLRALQWLTTVFLAGWLAGCASGRTVKIQDVYGQPLGGAQVELVTPTQDGASRTTRVVGTTGSSGRIYLAAPRAKAANERFSSVYLVERNGFMPFWVERGMLVDKIVAGRGFQLQDNVLVITLIPGNGDILLPPVR